jgi:hypothetical protein
MNTYFLSLVEKSRKREKNRCLTYVVGDKKITQKELPGYLKTRFPFLARGDRLDFGDRFVFIRYKLWNGKTWVDNITLNEHPLFFQGYMINDPLIGIEKSISNFFIKEDRIRLSKMSLEKVDSPSCGYFLVKNFRIRKNRYDLYLILRNNLHQSMTPKWFTLLKKRIKTKAVGEIYTSYSGFYSNLPKNLFVVY